MTEVCSTLSPNIWLIILQQLNITVYVISNNMIVFYNFKYLVQAHFKIFLFLTLLCKARSSIALVHVLVDNHLSQKTMVVHLTVSQNWSSWEQHLHDLCTTVVTRRHCWQSSGWLQIAKFNTKLKVYQYLILTESIH